MSNILQIPGDQLPALNRVMAALEGQPLAESAPPPASEPADPLAKMRCAVLVEHAPSPLNPQPLAILWFNGDESKGQMEAERWCRENPGKRAWVMTASAASPAIAGVHVKWNKE